MDIMRVRSDTRRPDLDQRGGVTKRGGAHGAEEMSHWMSIFDTAGYPTQPSQGHIQQTPPPYPTQDTQHDVDFTVPRQNRAPHRYMWSTPTQPPPRDPRPRRGQWYLWVIFVFWMFETYMYFDLYVRHIHIYVCMTHIIYVGDILLSMYETYFNWYETFHIASIN